MFNLTYHEISPLIFAYPPKHSNQEFHQNIALIHQQEIKVEEPTVVN